MTKILALDLGAESGRAVLGSFDGERVQLDVLHRFANGPVRLRDQYYWDALRLFEEMKQGLRLAVQKHGRVASLGVDTWGVDFALLGRGDELLGNPRHYRDPHTETIMEAAFRRVPREAIFRHTGIQFMRFNSLFQLLALQRDGSPLLEETKSLLFMPDLFNFWFTGVKANEVTIVSTSQFYDPVAKRWAYPLFDQFGLAKQMLGCLKSPGIQLGKLTEPMASETGAGEVPVMLPATHDTAAAVAAVPATGKNWCYLSSGTWSLMGVEIERPIIDEHSLGYNFTNEGGVNGTTRLLKNIMGLWLVQECRRSWERAGQSYGYDELARMAEAATPFPSLVDPDCPDFWLPASMPEAIAQFCRRTKQPAPIDPGAVVRCALESLALRYQWTARRLEDLTGRKIEVVHVVGGGSQNRLLNQLTADACELPVLAGPVEATAVGNVLTQALGLGLVHSLADIRTIVRNSFPMEKFEPRRSERWQAARARFDQLVAGTA